MSYSDDLDWLARNVHTWPKCIIDGEHRETLLWIEPSKGDVKAAFSSNPLHCFNRDQWLARRAELQNKPSWAGHQWPQIFQNEDWHWFGARAGWDFKAHIGGGWKGEGVSLLRDDGEYLQSGEVIGDWRDTLEWRPADLSEPAVTERLTEATKTVLAAAPALMGEKFSFDRNDWFERGELPPVGTVCEVLTLPAREKCTIIAHFKQQAAMVAVYTVDVGDDGRKEVDFRVANSFRPIRTEHEQLTSIIDGGKRVLAAPEAIADAILAAGFKRDGVRHDNHQEQTLSLHRHRDRGRC